MHMDDGESLWSRYGIQRIWFGGLPEQHDPKDSIYKGGLRVNVNAPAFLLYMHFKDYDGLKRFEEDNRHSEIRQAVYQALEKHTTILYRTASAQKTAKAKAEYYANIELVIGHKIKRWDFLNKETIRQMVTTTRPVPFGRLGSRSPGKGMRPIGGKQ